MKHATILAAAALMAYVPYAHAGFVGPSAEPVVSVEEAKKMPDDTHIILKGYIENSLGGEKYVFKDNTGSIEIEIDDEDWRGLNVSPKDKVEIHGEVDTHLMKPTDIDVDSIQLAK